MITRVEGICGDRKLSFETGKLAKQANGAVVVQYGDTVLLVTAVMGEAREGIDFFPLTVEFREKSYAAGVIPGGFFKREGRPATEAILCSRLTDRPIRPMFPEGFAKEVQIMATILSYDGINSPEVLSICGTSLALMISNIPFLEPVAAVKMGMINGEYIVNLPSDREAESDLNLVIAGTETAVTMVESGSRELNEDQILKAIEIGHEEIRKIIKLQKEVIEKINPQKCEFNFEPNPIVEEVVSKYYDRAVEALFSSNISKHERDARFKRLEEEILEEYAGKIESEELSKSDFSSAFETLKSKAVRNELIRNNRRVDERLTTEIRPISCETSILPRTHGSALFTRGETQALCILTLGTGRDEQRSEYLGLEEKKSFMLHYNFEPFSTGECKPLRGPGRREIGHGALAERALSYVIPKAEDFPYTIRLVSEILESNGSSSMASVCAGTMAMMNGGVKISKPVAGIAMGLITEGSDVRILSDIRGTEDHYGDMDFKVAGTQDGITALQMDIKIKDGLSQETMKKALYQAKEGRLHILSEMGKCIKMPETEISQYAPRMYQITIDTEKIGMVIGPGGKSIRNIVEITGAEVDISDDGTVKIFSSNSEMALKAKQMVEMIVKEIEVGEIYDGTVKRVTTFGAFVELIPGKEGLVHISQLDLSRVDKVEDVVDVGDKVKVKVIEIDDMKRINLSRKVLLEGYNEEESDRPRPRRDDSRKEGGGNRYDRNKKGNGHNRR